MDSFTFNSSIDNNGNIKIHDKVRLNQFKESHKNCNFEVEFRQIGNKRSERQNRWYWSQIQYIITQVKEREGIKYSKDYVHSYITTNVIESEPKIQRMFGKEYMVFNIKRTSNMTKKEFSDFVDVMIEHFAQQNIDVQPPPQI